jgi:Uncharacterized conserved protein
MEQSIDKIWQLLEKTQKEYAALNLHEAIDYEKFYLYSIISHSTAIEGSSLSELDTQLLLDDGIVNSSKTMIEHLMNLDLKKAYDFAIEEAKKKTKITPDFLKEMNSLVLKNTGGIVNAAGGTFDSSKGDFRRCTVFAGGVPYMDFQKVIPKTEILCKEINKVLDATKTLKDIYNLSFDAHLNLVTIHPWADGNGRTSRLLMNYIQFYNDVVPSKLLQEEKQAYIQALNKSRSEETPEAFREFMAKQHLQTLKQEIDNYRQNLHKSNNFTLLF